MKAEKLHTVFMQGNKESPSPNWGYAGITKIAVKLLLLDSVSCPRDRCSVQPNRTLSKTHLSTKLLNPSQKSETQGGTNTDDGISKILSKQWYPGDCTKKSKQRAQFSFRYPRNTVT